mgnify:FL=1
MISRTTGISLFLAAALAFGGLGCGDDFLPASYLNGLRVLALVADPVEIGPADRVTITPTVYLPDGENLISQHWSFCPFSLGPTTGYECAVPACEVSLPWDENGVVNPIPGVLVLSCIDEFAAEDLEGVPSEVPDRVEVYFSYRIASSTGEEREAVLKLGLWTMGPPAELNQSPVVSFMSIDGTPVQPGTIAGSVTEEQEVEIRVQVNPESLDEYTDQAGNLRTEEAIVSFYSTAGRFEYDRVSGTDARVSWKAEKLEPGQTEAEVYITVRDLRGGQVVFGPVTIPIIQ